MNARVTRYAAALSCSFAHLFALTAADVLITTPAAGANIKAGTIEVQWKDSGIAPPISELTQFTLSLMTGGNEDGDMLLLTTFESQGIFNSDNSAQGTIPSGMAAGIENGFFFQMVSTKEAGGTVINYSSRFSIDGLTGATPLKYSQAAQALDGSTQGPAAVGESNSTSATSTQSSRTKTEDGLSNPSPTTNSNPSHATSISDQASITQTSAPTSKPSSSSSSDTGLSTGAVAGIAIGAALLGLIILGAIIAFLYLRRRKERLEVQEIDPPQRPFLDGKAELSGEEIKPPMLRSRATELSVDSITFEAGSGERPAELDHMAFRAELEGSAPPSPYTTAHEKGFC